MSLQIIDANMLQKLKLSFFLLITVVITGCATPASQNAMSIGVADVPQRISSELKGQVNVRSVTGGKETNPIWISRVDNQGFKSALEQSLVAVGYKAQNGSTAKYQIDVTLNELEQPAFGLTFDVKSTVTYAVNGGSEGQKIFPITALGTAAMSDAFVGMERMRIANERSIKENIKQFLQKISSDYSK